jgi:acetyl esterase/lipase
MIDHCNPGELPDPSGENANRIDPELARALELVPIGPNGFFDLTDIPRAREVAAASAGVVDDHPLEVTVEEHLVSRPDAPGVPIRLIRPQPGDADRPVLLWFHGGGQVLGSAAQDDAFLKSLSLLIGCAVVAVDYRLAPETRAPGAAEDGLAAYRWVGREAGRLGLDGARIGLAGRSGGGGIAAAVALLIRDRDAGTPRFQSLIYPMLDDRNVTMSSYEITDLGLWDRATNILAWQAILGDRYGSADLSPYAAPARATDLRGLPPTFIAVGDLDCFRDEDLDYANRLRQQRVPVELHLYPGAYHCFDLVAPQSRLAVSLQQSWIAHLIRAFAVDGRRRSTLVRA